MSTVRRLVVIAVGLALAAVLPGCGDEPHPPVVTAAQLKDAPLTISVSTVGSFAKGRSWHLSVNSAGQAELTINTFPEPTRRQFQVTKEQLAEFRKALLDERFFELAGEYGERVPDGSEKVITVTAGRHSHSVKIHFLMNWVQTDK